MRVCAVVACGRRVHAKSLCEAHYDRWRLHSDVRPLDPIRSPNARPLWVCECPEPVLGLFNECQRCHRKPKALLGVMEQR